jgi:hypothetical protein
MSISCHVLMLVILYQFAFFNLCGHLNFCSESVPWCWVFTDHLHFLCRQCLVEIEVPFLDVKQ